MAPRDPLVDDTVDANPTDPSVDAEPARLSATAFAHLPTGEERYRLGASLGAGGMGEVLAAHDAQIGREVAIKRMHVPARGSGARFLREARIQGMLEHPSIVPIHEVAVDASGRPYFVMKRLAGTTLAEILASSARDERHSTARLLRAFVDVCLAVEFAHEKGVLHRDLKPANIMLGDFGEVYVLDWGIARMLTDAIDTLDGARPESQPGETAAGAVLGTDGYMPPEQRRGTPVDRRADVFALGCILFEILTREPLLSPAMPDAVLAPYESRPSVRAPALAIPPELDAVVVRATEPDREARIPSARALGEVVERYLDGDRELARRRQIAGDQLALARTALAADQRATAMHHAGRALALDPTNTDAAALVGRMILEPPREIPPAVEAELAAMEERTLRRHAKATGVAFLLYLAFLPLMRWVGATDPMYLGIVALLGVLDAGLAFHVVRARTRPSAALLAAIVVVNACLLFLMARMFGGFLVAPGIACGTMFAFSLHPRFGPTWLLAAAMSGGIVGATLGELAGLLPATYEIAGGRISLGSAAGEFVAPNVEIAHSVYIVALIYAVGLLARAMVRSQREARREALLQAWHLRQLVPPS